MNFIAVKAFSFGSDFKNKCAKIFSHKSHVNDDDQSK